MIILDMTVVNIALPSIARDLHFSRDRPVLGAQRVHADVRRPAAARRPGRATSSADAGCSWPGMALFTVASLVGGPATSAGRLLAARAAAGRGRRGRHPRRAGADHRQLPRGPGAHPRARPLHRRGHGRRVARPGARRRDHRVGRPGAGCCSSTCRSASLVAGARAAVPVRDRRGSRAASTCAGRADLDRRHDRAGVRLHPGRRRRLERPAGPGCVRPPRSCCSACSCDTRRRAGAADHPAAAVRRPPAGRAPTWPGCCSSRACSGCSSSSPSSCRTMLRLQPAPGGAGVPADDASRCSRCRPAHRGCWPRLAPEGC